MTAPSERLKSLTELGQAPWLDSISREWLDDGSLAQMRDQYCLRGVTSNPSIFAKALASSTYDDDIRSLIDAGKTDRQIFHELAIADIQRACDIFADVHETTGDGYVSIEIDPDLTEDTQASIEQGQELWKRIDRPNVMIKVPATPQGLPVIEQLIADGINVNVTLLFDVMVYSQVRNAWLTGLERRRETGATLKNVASVASFFVSRVDTLVDALLERSAADTGELTGRTAVSNAIMAWEEQRAGLDEHRWKSLAEFGAVSQRLLWASTGTKDPAYSDVKYVDSLIADNTVNTMPLDTIKAFADHGTPRIEVDESHVNTARGDMMQLANAGIDMSEVTDQLLREGVASFEASFDELLGSIAQRRKALTH